MDKQLKLKRFGYVNYFGYKSEEFELSDGVAVIKGDNGTGKTMSVTSILPSLLIMDLKRSINLGSLPKEGRDPIKLVGTKTDPSYIWMEIGNDEFTKAVAGIYWKGNDGRIIERCVIFNDGIHISNDNFISTGKNVFYDYNSFKMQNEDLYEQIYDTKQRMEYKKRINELFFGFKDMEQFDTNINFIYALESATQGRDEKDINKALIESELKKVLPDYDENIMDGIESFYLTIKENKEQIEKRKEEEKAALVLEELSNYLAFHNNSLIEKIQKDSNRIDRLVDKQTKSITKKDDELRGKISELEKTKNELAELENERANVSNKLNSLDLTNIKEINSLINKNQVLVKNKEKDIKMNESILISYKRNLDKIKSRINNLKLSVESEESFLLDNSDIVELIKTHPNIKTDIEKQSNLITKISELNNKHRVNVINQKSLLDDLKVTEKNGVDLEEELNIQKNVFVNEATKWIENVGISVPDELSYDTFVENDGYDYEVNEEIQSLQSELFELENKMRNFNLDKNDIIRQINLLNDSKKPQTPAVHDGGIELYECVNFKRGIDDETKFGIEEQLRMSGLLFSVIDPDNISEGLLLNNKQHNTASNGQTLLDVLEVDYNLSPESRFKVEKLLNSINVSNEGKIQYFDFDIISNNKSSFLKYIGAEEREKARQEKIFKLSSELEKLEGKLKNLFSIKEKINFRLNSLNQLKNEIPDRSSIIKLQYQLEYNAKSIIYIKEKIKNLTDSFIKFNEDMFKLNGEMLAYIPNNLFDLNNMKKNINEVETSMSDLNASKNNLQELQIDLKTTEETISNLEDRIEELDIEKEEFLKDIQNLKAQIESKKTQEQLLLSEKLKNRIEEINLLSNDKNKVIGGLESSIGGLEKELKVDKGELDNLREQKAVKDELISDNHLLIMKDYDKNKTYYSNSSKKINDLMKEYSDIGFLDYEIFESQPHDFSFASTTSKLSEMVSIESNYKNILEINFTKDDEVYDFDHVMKDIIDALDISQQIIDKGNKEVYEKIAGQALARNISEVVEKAFEIGTEIKEEMENRQQINNISFFIEYRFRNNISRFEKDFFSKGSNRTNQAYKNSLEKFVEELVKIVEDGIDNSENDDDILKALFEKLNYKNVIDVNITYKRNSKAPVESLKNNIGGELSGGQTIRAIIEPMIVILKRNIDKSELGPNAFRFVLLDEGFLKVDDTQKQILEDNVYENFGTVLIASSDTVLYGPKEGKKTIDYIRLDKIVGDGGKEFVYIDDIRSVKINYDYQND